MTTDLLTVVIRFGLYANLMILFGWPLFSAYTLSAQNSAATSSRLALVLLALSAALLSLAGMIVLAAAMTGGSMGAIPGAAVEAIVFETPIGSAWLVRMAALVAVALLAITGGVARRFAMVGVAAGAAIALASLAWTGHGAAGEGVAGWVQLAADIVHLLAAGAWVGALVALAMIVRRGATGLATDDVITAHRALYGFATAGTIIVALLVGTGIVSSWILVGPEHLFTLFDSEYGRLLGVKLLLFAAMLGLAAMNRFRLTPSLAKTIAARAPPAPAFADLRRSIIVETSLAAAVLAVVAWLGTLAPPMAT